jgi:hypothetical protein
MKKNFEKFLKRHAWKMDAWSRVDAPQGLGLTLLRV